MIPSNSTSLMLVDTTTPAERSSEFVAVSGGQETTSAGALLIAAYILMWACVFGLVWMSLRRFSQLNVRLSELERQLAKKDTESRAHAS